MWSTTWLFVLESVVIVTGNVTTLLVFTSRGMRKRKHIMVTNLAVADLLVGMIAVPMHVYRIESPKNKTYDQVFLAVDILTISASIFGLTKIATERAYAIYYPFKHRTLRKNRFFIGIAVAWSVALILGLSSLSSTISDLFLVIFPIPLATAIIFMIIAYILIWLKVNRARRHNQPRITPATSNAPSPVVTRDKNHVSSPIVTRGKNHGSSPIVTRDKNLASNHNYALYQERERHLIVTLVIVTVVSLIAYAPVKIVLIYEKLCKCYVNYYIFMVVKILHYGNSLANPIIYAMRMPEFRNIILHKLKNRKTQVNVRVDHDRPLPHRSQQETKL